MGQGVRGGGGRLLMVMAAAVAATAGCHEGGPQRGLGSFEASPAPLEFGPVALGRDRVLELDLKNRGRVPYTVYEIASSVPNVEVLDFAPVTLESGEVKRVQVRFIPDVEGKVTGAVTILSDEQPDPVAVPLAGVGVRAFAEVLTSGLDFGRVDVDTSKVLMLDVENPTTVETAVIVSFVGENAASFSSSEANEELLLQPGERRSIPIAFKPQTLGLADGFARLEVCGDCEPVSVPLTGEGIANALEIYPTRVDFGRVSLGATASQQVTIVNQGTEPLDFNGAVLEEDPGGALEVVATPGSIPPAGSAQVEVRFTAQKAGPIKNTLRLKILAGNTAQEPRLSVKGEGGASCLTLLPRDVDFGMVPEGMSATRRVDLLNRCMHDVQVVDAKVGTSEGGYFSMGQMATSLVVPAGKIEPIRVTFNPKPGSSQSEGTLTLTIAELNALSTEQVSLKGASKSFAPCTWELLPAALDFGAVPVGAEVTLGLSLKNAGSDDCFIGTMQMASGSDPEFYASPMQSQVVKPGNHATLMVTFKPSTAGNFAGLAEGWVNHPTDNHPTAMVTGTGITSCFALQPTQVDYGTLKLSCGPKTRSITAYNSCAAPVVMQGGVLEQPATTDFSVVSQPAANVSLAAGAQAKFDIRYEPQDEGLDSAALRVTAGEVTYTASLQGSALENPLQTDRFAQEAKSKVDILFVIDNSGSMMEEQTSLGQNFSAFMSAAQASNVDWRIAVTTTGIQASPGGWAVCPGGAEGGEAGRFFPVNGSSPRILTPQTPNVAQVFATNVAVGVCHWDEQGLEAAYRALSQPLVNNVDAPGTSHTNDGNAGFLREDAKLAIIIVSDEEDFSPQPVSFYETFFKSLKNDDPTMLSISAIVSPANLSTCPTGVSSGNRYIQLAQGTNGVVDSICTQDWASSLSDISENIYGPSRRFPLSQEPGDVAQIVVTVNGVPQSTGWSYEAQTNSVLFEETAAPPSGSSVEVTYPLGC